MVVQSYETDVFKENVILGNDALMKCSIPSFVADSVEVMSWVDSEGNEVASKQDTFGNWNCIRCQLALSIRLRTNIKNLI